MENILRSYIWHVSWEYLENVLCIFFITFQSEFSIECITENFIQKKKIFCRIKIYWKIGLWIFLHILSKKKPWCVQNLTKFQKLEKIYPFHLIVEVEKFWTNSFTNQSKCNLRSPSHAPKFQTKPSHRPPTTTSAVTSSPLIMNSCELQKKRN